MAGSRTLIKEVYSSSARLMPFKINLITKEIN